jgi:hypothetical protein
MGRTFRRDSNYGYKQEYRERTDRKLKKFNKRLRKLNKRNSEVEAPPKEVDQK